MHCVITAADDSKVGVTVTVDEVDGDNLRYHIAVDDNVTACGDGTAVAVSGARSLTPPMPTDVRPISAALLPVRLAQPWASLSSEIRYLSVTAAPAGR